MTDEILKRGRGRPNGTKILRRRYMIGDELERFIKVARKAKKKYDLLFSLVYFFAMRVAEVVNLRLEDFNLPSHQITIRALKGGRFRAYGLPEQIERKFIGWMKQRAKLYGADENPWVFPSSKLPRSGHMSRDAAQAEFWFLCQKAGVPLPRSIHDL